MRIIHFSDVHFKPGASISKSQRLVERFIDALKVVQQQKPIDLIIFSGDMIDRGGKDFPSMSNAFMNFKNLIIDKILSSLNLGHDRFVFVCGNHDIVRDKDSQYVEKGLATELNDITSLDDFVRDPNSIDNVKRIEDFNNFRHKFYAELPDVEYHETPYQSNLVLSIDVIPIPMDEAIREVENRRLGVEYYREMNDIAAYRVIGGEFYISNLNNILPEIDINYNLYILRELSSILYEIYTSTYRKL